MLLNRDRVLPFKCYTARLELMPPTLMFLVVHLGDEVAAEEVGDDTFLGDFEAALGAKAVDRLHLEPATWVNDAVGQLL